MPLYPPGTAPVGAPQAGGASWSGGAFTTPALAPNGTALAPAYAFSDQSLGLYYISSAAMGISMAGVLKWRFSTVQVQAPPWGFPTTPQYSFNGDTGTGIASPTTGQVSVVASAVTIAAFGLSGMSLFSGVVSLNTFANASGQTTAELRLVFQASGISLMYSSGKSSYMIAGSAQSVAQA